MIYKTFFIAFCKNEVMFSHPYQAIGPVPESDIQTPAPLKVANFYFVRKEVQCSETLTSVTR